MSEDPYLASEDSALLRGALGSYSGGSCLEIGAGNGGNIVELRKRFGFVVGTDIRRPGMSDWRGAGAEYVLGDEASCFRDSAFDLVAFNPPYLDGEGRGDRSVDGGATLEVPRKFLRGALRVVKPGGSVVFLLNDSARLEDFEREGSKLGFKLRRVASRRVFFEELVVYEAAGRAGR